VTLFERFYREEGFDDAVAVFAVNLRQILKREDTSAFVSEIGGKEVGAAALSTAFGLEAGAYAELEDLYVDPARRGHGDATSLVAAGAFFLMWLLACFAAEIWVEARPVLFQYLATVALYPIFAWLFVQAQRVLLR